MTLDAAPIPGSQLLKRDISFANIAGIVSREDIIFGVGTLWFSFAWLQRYLVVKSEYGGMPSRQCWINGLSTKIANISITFKDGFVVYWLNDCFKLMGFTAMIGISAFFGVCFTPLPPTLSICLFVIGVVSRPVFLVLAVLYAIALSELWRMTPSLLLSRFTNLAMRITSSKAIFMRVELFKEFFNATLRAEFVTRAWDWFYFRVMILFTPRIISALFTCGPSTIGIPIIFTELFDRLLDTTCSTHFYAAAIKWRSFYSGVVSSLTALRRFACVADGYSSISTFLVFLKFLDRFRDATFSTNFCRMWGIIVEKWQLVMVQWRHGFHPLIQGDDLGIQGIATALCAEQFSSHYIITPLTKPVYTTFMLPHVNTSNAWRCI